MRDRVATGRTMYASAARRTLRLLILAPAGIGLVVGSPGCMTRADRPVVGADSTLVYPSKLPSDVNASITFQLKDSALRDEARRADRERGREMSRLRKEQSRLLKLEERREKQQKAEEKRKAAAEKKAKRTKKGKKSKSRAEAEVDAPKARAGNTPQREPAETASTAESTASDSAPRLSIDAIRDSLSAVESRLRALAVEDSLAELAPWRQMRPDGSPPDERVVETEEGARVQANIRLENVYARGRRPLALHFVWINPAQKKIFKRLLEYMPNDSDQVLTSSLTISPSKRAPGIYSLRVYLFRELIAEKFLELRGTGHEEQEEGEDQTM